MPISSPIHTLSSVRTLFSLAISGLVFGMSHVAFAHIDPPESWHKLQNDLILGVEDRTNLFNDFFNDEAPQYHPKGWMMPNSRFMAIAQGSHLLADRINQPNDDWQTRHENAHQQWTDIVLEGKPAKKWRYFINANLTESELILDETYLNIPLSPLSSKLQLKAGLFFSAFGRLNNQHVHDRDFIDAPMIYQRLFGDATALQETGIQLTYTFTPSWMMGIEGLSATNRDQFAQDRLEPKLQTIFTRWATAWTAQTYSLIGLSWAKGDMMDARQMQNQTDWQAIDITLKHWLPQHRYWMLQGEWLNRQHAHQTLAQQSGYYVMGLYRLNEQWRIGARHEQAETASGNLFSQPSLPNSTKNSLLVEYDPTSWSRLRVQLGIEQQSSGVEGSYLLLGWQMGIHWLE